MADPSRKKRKIARLPDSLRKLLEVGIHERHVRVALRFGFGHRELMQSLFEGANRKRIDQVTSMRSALEKKRAKLTKLDRHVSAREQRAVGEQFQRALGELEKLEVCLTQAIMSEAVGRLKERGPLPCLGEVSFITSLLQKGLSHTEIAALIVEIPRPDGTPWISDARVVPDVGESVQDAIRRTILVVAKWSAKQVSRRRLRGDPRGRVPWVLKSTR